ncbi:MAG: hypothetical protein ACK4E8_06605 [Lacibacter sp.]
MRELKENLKENAQKMLKINKHNHSGLIRVLFDSKTALPSKALYFNDLLFDSLAPSWFRPGQLFPKWKQLKRNEQTPHRTYHRTISD